MGICIYCGNEEAASNEHILQDSLGAKWEKTNILCTTCNNLFGRTIDKSLAEEFAFFKNFLSIRGKRDNVSQFKMTNAEGETIIRDGKTGSITTPGNVRVEKKDIGDNTYTISVHSDVANSEKIFDDIRKGTERKGYSIAKITVQDYVAEPIGMMHAKLSFTLPTYVALRKSLVNYWCSQRRDQDFDKIQNEAIKIHSFADFCDNNADAKDRVAYAKSLGIDGFPLTVELSGVAKNIISGSDGLFHSIFLVERGDSLFGGVCLFNSIQWGFKIHDIAPTAMPISIAIFDIQNQSTIKNLENTKDISSFEFQFTQYTHEERLKKMQSQFSDAVGICAAFEHYTSVRSICEPEEIENIFPIEDRNVIEKIFLERAAIILGWEYAQKGTPPSFFKSDEGNVLSQILVDGFFEKVEPDFALTRETYMKFICGAFEIAKQMAENKPLHVTKSSMMW